MMYLGIPHWNIQELCGYEPITSFWADFSIADIYGNTAIRQTYQTAFKNWKGNYKYLTELVLVLNHKIWQWSEQNEERAKLYNDLWMETDDYACSHLKGEEASYYFSVTD